MFLAFLCSFSFEYLLCFIIVGPTTTSFDFIKPNGKRGTFETLTEGSSETFTYNSNNPFTFTFEFPGCTFTQSGYATSYSIVPEVNEDYLSNICQVRKFPQYLEKTYLKVSNDIENEDVKLYYENKNEKIEIAKSDPISLESSSSYFNINFYVTSSKCKSYEKIGYLRSTGDKDSTFAIKDKDVPSKCIQQTPPSQTYYLKIKNSLSESYKLFALRSGSYVEIQRGTTKNFTDTSTFTMNLYITSSKCPEYTLVGIHQASTSSSDVDVIDDNRVPDKCVVTDEDESSKILKYTLSSTVNNIRRPIQIHIVKEAADGCIPSKNSPLESLSSSKDNSLEKSGTSNNRKNSKNSPNVMLIVGFVAAMAAIVAIVVIYKKNAGKSSQ